MSPPLLTAVVLLIFLASGADAALEILSKSTVESCDSDSGAGGRLSCGQKLVLNVAVSSDSSGEEASLVVKEAEQNDTKAVQVIRDPPVITINKSAVYAAYDLIYLRGDQDRINKSLKPQFVVEGRFQRINQHPGAGVHSFSVGVTEILQSNLRVELNADDIEYVYQRSPGKIISIEVPTFEALSQVGTANVTTKNVGKLEASYSLTFNCLSGIDRVEEQAFTMKPNETITRLFDLHTSTDQAGNYTCTAILKASDFSELDRGQCQVSTTPTVLNNGTQIGPSGEHEKGGDDMGFFATIKAYWRRFWDRVIDFFTGRLSWAKCSSFSDLSCHFKYLWIGWMLLVGLVLAAVSAVAVLPWLLHRQGYFDPLYDWWEDLFSMEPRMKIKQKSRHLHCWHSQHHNHHAHPRHYHHHRVLHRQDEQLLDATTTAGGLVHKRNPALSVQHRDNKKKHWHGKEMATWDG